MIGMDSSQIELPVLFDGCQKWITGITKRTTCDDVIYALLRHAFQEGTLDLNSFVMYEMWRGSQRLLSGRTKLSKLWRSWGEEIVNVTFAIRKMDPVDVWDTNSEVSRLHVKPKRNRDRRRLSRAGQWTASEVFQKLQTQREAQHSFTQSAIQADAKPLLQTQQEVQQAVGEIEKQKQNVQSQDKQLRELVARISYTDDQIEYYETTIHHRRQQRKGDNYIQSAYLKERSEDSSTSGEELFPKIKANDMEAYLKICENILDLQSKIDTENNRINDILDKLKQESGLGHNFHDQFKSVSAVDTVGSSSEIQSLREQLQKAVSLNSEQQSQLEHVCKVIDEYDGLAKTKHGNMDELSKELQHIERTEHNSIRRFSPTQGENFPSSNSSAIGSAAAPHMWNGLGPHAKGPDLERTCPNEFSGALNSSSNSTNKHPPARRKLGNLSNGSSERTRTYSSFRNSARAPQYISNEAGRERSTSESHNHEANRCNPAGQPSQSNFIRDVHSRLSHRDPPSSSKFDPKGTSHYGNGLIQPYITYVRYKESSSFAPGSVMHVREDSNSDTGMSSLHSEEDAVVTYGASPLPQGQGLVTLV